MYTTLFKFLKNYIGVIFSGFSHHSSQSRAHKTPSSLQDQCPSRHVPSTPIDAGMWSHLDVAHSHRCHFWTSALESLAQKYSVSTTSDPCTEYHPYYSSQASVVATHFAYSMASGKNNEGGSNMGVGRRKQNERTSDNTCLLILFELASLGPKCVFASHG